MSNIQGRYSAIFRVFKSESDQASLKATPDGAIQHLGVGYSLNLDGLSAKYEFGWAELSYENDDTGADMLSRASAEIQNILG